MSNVHPQHQESFNLRDSSLGMSDSAAPANMVPLSEQIQNLALFDRLAEPRGDKSVLSQPNNRRRDSHEDRLPHFDLSSVGNTNEVVERGNLTHSVLNHRH